MARTLTAVHLALIFTLTSAAAPAPAAQMFGFTADESAAQRSIEQRFDANLKTEDLSAWLKNLSS